MTRIWMAGLIGAGWLAGAAVARAEEASATVVKTIQIDGGGSPEEIAAAVQKAVQAALTNLPSGAQVPAGAAQVKVMYEDGAEVDPSKKAAMVQAVHAALGQAGIWQPLFNGRDLDGWRASENTGSFSVVDGAIKVFGPRSHLFYTGPVNGAAFTNFEFEAEVMTKPGANSGIFIHTAWQESGWPKQGYEAQVDDRLVRWRKAVEEALAIAPHAGPQVTEQEIISLKKKLK